MLDYKISMSLLSLNLSLPALLKETYDTNPIGTIVKAYQQQQAQLEINNSNNNKSVSASAPAPSASVNPVPKTKQNNIKVKKHNRMVLYFTLSRHSNL
jgi:hypothetical protein